MKKSELVAVLAHDGLAELSIAIENIDDAAQERFAEQYRAAQKSDVVGNNEEHSDHSPDTEGRPAALDVVGGSVSAMIDQIAPNRARFVPDSPKLVEDVNVEIERDHRGGRMMYVFTADGDMQSIRLMKHGRRWETVLDRNYSRIAVKAATLPKLVKLWAKKSGVWAKQIDITV
jgi:hypothetical protein